jgi:hypothetical protein
MFKMTASLQNDCTQYPTPRHLLRGYTKQLLWHRLADPTQLPKHVCWIKPQSCCHAADVTSMVASLCCCGLKSLLCAEPAVLLLHHHKACLLTWLLVSSQRGHVGGAAKRVFPDASASGSGCLLLCPHAMLPFAAATVVADGNVFQS